MGGRADASTRCVFLNHGSFESAVFLARDEATRERHRDLARKVRRDFLKPVTAEGVARFLGLDTKVI
jgi:hypothetical protein